MFASNSRRDWLRHCLFGIGATSQSGWFAQFAAAATPDPVRRKSVILIWLEGGPATIDLWDLKPGSENGGPFQEISTASDGIRISEHLAKLAKCTESMAIVRSMTSKEGDHGRATLFTKTGYTPLGAIQFPAFGSLMASELAIPQSDLPGFVSIAPGRFSGTLGGGFLGPHYSPLAVGERESRAEDDLSLNSETFKVPNLELPPGISAQSQVDRLTLLERLETRFDDRRSDAVVAGIRSSNSRAVRLMDANAAAAFRLEEESESHRDSYGRNLFGQGCLLARRLIERGVACIEVTLRGWDSHQNNFERVKALSQTLDSGLAALLSDLKERGMLDSTLVMCLGEFGRTPKINNNLGRDHWPQSWSAMIAGGGIRGGQVIGRTNADGTQVEDRPTTVPDLIATACKAVGIDPMKQNLSNVGRPIRIADPNARPIAEVL